MIAVSLKQRMGGERDLSFRLLQSWEALHIVENVVTVNPVQFLKLIIVLKFSWEEASLAQ